MITFERIDEDKLKARSKWQSLADIPDFPFQSFDDLRESFKDANPPYSLHFDYEAARQFIPLIGTYSTRGLYILLSSVWVLTIIVCLMAGPILRQYLIMLGAFFALFGHVLGNPVNPLSRTLRYVAIFALFFFLSFVATGKTVGAWLVGSFTVSFWGNRALYALKRIVLYRALIMSEPLFLYLYSNGGCFLKHSETGQIILARQLGIDLSRLTETSPEETSDEPTVTQTESKQCPVCGMQNQASLHRCKRCGYDFSQEEP